jgi:hypothetical protein
VLINTHRTGEDRGRQRRPGAGGSAGARGVWAWS